MLLTVNLTSTSLIIWSICVGVILAFVISHIYRRLLGPLVRTLIAYDHTSTESAATLDELKLNKRLVRLMLRDGSPAMTYISVVGNSIPRLENNKYDYASARFFVPEEKKEKSSKSFVEPERLWVLILFIAIIIGCAYGLTKLVPIIIALL
jgi:hypothetical protein